MSSRNSFAGAAVGQEVRKACGHFRRPQKRNYSTVNFTLWQKKHALFTEVDYRLLPPKFDLKRHILYSVNLKRAVQIMFLDSTLQRHSFQSKNTPEKYSQSSPRAPKTSPNCLRGPPGRPEQPRSVPGAIFGIIYYTLTTSGPPSVDTWDCPTPQCPPCRMYLWYNTIYYIFYYCTFS